MLQTDLFLNQAKAPRQSWRERTSVVQKHEEPKDIHSRIIQGDMTLTPDIAKEVLEHCHFDGQRKVFYYQVRLLADMMTNGEWLPGDQITFCELPDGKKVLANGYHRMSSIIQSGVSNLFNIRIIQAKDMNAVRRAYITFDTGTRSRSEAEVINAMGIADEFGLTKQMSAAIYKAAPLLANGMRHYNYQTSSIEIKNVTQRIMLADDLWALGKKYQDLISGAAYRHRAKMLLSGVCGVAIATIKWQPEIASRFWPRVADMAGLSTDDPRMALAKALGERKYKADTKDGDVPLSAIDTAIAWNAFFKKGKLTILKTALMKNFHVLGTRWRKD